MFVTSGQRRYSNSATWMPLVVPEEV